MNWREKAAPIIAQVIQEVGRDDEKKLRAALREAYPFGEKEFHPYKIWRSEIKRQLGEPAQAMSVAVAQRLADEICQAWLFDDLQISFVDSERLRRLADDLDKCAPLLNAAQVMIAEKDAKFLRRLAEKTKSKAPVLDRI